MLKRIFVVLAVGLLFTLTIFGQINEDEAKRRCGANPIAPHWKNVRDGNEYEIAEGMVQRSIAAYTDFPPHHWSHDLDFYVRVDDVYKGLTSTANENGILARHTGRRCPVRYAEDVHLHTRGWRV